MIFTPGIAVSQLSGSVGGTTASRNRGGQYFRNRAIPSTVTSTEAQNAKAILAARSQAWQGLTQAQRDTWVEWARQNPIINALGRSITLSGQQAYIQINARLAHDSQTLITAPPISAPPAGLLTMTQSCDIGAGTFDLTYTDSPLAAGVKLWIEAAVTNSAGIDYVSNLYRFVGTSAAAQASPFDHQTLVENRFGTLVVGQYVHVRVRTFDTATGLTSVPRQAKTIVSTT